MAMLMMCAAVANSAAPSPQDHAKMFSRFAGDVNKTLPLAEHPNPLRFRPTWKNLNGLWKIYVSDSDSNPEGPLPNPEPFPSDHLDILVPFPLEAPLAGCCGFPPSPPSTILLSP